MKTCPKCKVQYPDDTLDFCLEDGSKLLSNYSSDDEKETVVRRQFKTAEASSEKTVNLPFQQRQGEYDSSTPENIASESKNPERNSDSVNTDVLSQSHRVLELSTIVVALAHNWWQWIYLNNQYYSTFWTYFFSANFLMWLLLLVGGTIISLYSLKQSRNKIYAVISLVILSINLLLFLVPKR